METGDILTAGESPVVLFAIVRRGGVASNCSECQASIMPWGDESGVADKVGVSKKLSFMRALSHFADWRGGNKLLRP